MPKSVTPTIAFNGIEILLFSNLAKEYKIYPDIKPAVFAINNSRQDAQLTYIEKGGEHTRYKIEKKVRSSVSLSLATIFLII
jgi:hypothetical protein